MPMTIFDDLRLSRIINVGERFHLSGSVDMLNFVNKFNPEFSPRLIVQHALKNREDGTVVAAAKLQELFGLAETPRIGARQQPVVFELLSPSGRPVQTTSDLRSFWQRTYPEVRKELRGRYPRHPWPDDPWTAEPTHRVKKRG